MGLVKVCYGRWPVAVVQRCGSEDYVDCKGFGVGVAGFIGEIDAYICWSKCWPGRDEAFWFKFYVMFVVGPACNWG